MAKHIRQVSDGSVGDHENDVRAFLDVLGIEGVAVDGREVFLPVRWSYGKRNSEPDVDYSQLLEEKVYELGGIKTLISRNHYTPERFREIYHQENYAEAKRRLDPGGVFPQVYEKFHRAK